MESIRFSVNAEVPGFLIVLLRAAFWFLRQDPDIVMVGEIHDNETANLAIQRP